MNSQSSTKTEKAAPKAAKIRALLSEGRTTREIAAMTGTTKQYVYNVKMTMKVKPVPEKRGRPKGSKNVKQKSALDKQVEKMNEAHRAAIEQHVEHLRKSQKVLFAGPEPKLSFMQRVRVLFTGVV